MGRRPRAARFLPGVYVFPGGAVEPADRLVEPATRLCSDVTAHVCVRGSTARARALAITAVRETFEETGLMLAAAGDPGVSGHPGWEHWRARGLAPHLACLEMTGRAITPAPRPIRFHARFFVAEATHLRGTIGGDGELEDIGWVPLAEARRLPLADVQDFLVEHLEQVLGRDEHPRERPLFTHRRGARYVRYS